MNRIIIEAALNPIFSTIQPVSFVDVGHSLYIDPISHQHCLIVDTPQSVANYLEAVSWNHLKLELVETLTGLPYIKLINKMTLNHRIGSGYLALHKESPLKKILIEEIADNGLYPTLFKYDPNSIIHGCFLNRLGGSEVHRVPRLIIGRIEANNVVSVPMGGASIDPISASGKDWDMSFFEKDQSKDNHKSSSFGLGNVPYHIKEYSCASVTAKFVINCDLIEATGLPPKAQDLLKAIAQWKILQFLHNTIRLRSTEYECGEIRGQTKELDLLEQEIPQLIKTCSLSGYFVNPVVTDISITLKPKPQESKTKDNPTNNQIKQEELCSQLELNC